MQEEHLDYKAIAVGARTNHCISFEFRFHFLFVLVCSIHFSAARILPHHLLPSTLAKRQSSFLYHTKTNINTTDTPTGTDLAHALACLDVCSLF
jgi:hypothetical protein